MKLKNVLLLITPSSPGRFNGAARYAKEHGWHLTVADRLTHPLTGWTGDGALVTLRDDDTVLDQIRALRRGGIPVVDLTCSRPAVRLPRVCGDNDAIGRMAAGHFRSRNYRNTAWFSTSWGPQEEARSRAFGAGERWVWTKESGSARYDDWKALSRWLAKKLLAAARPLGVFCYDDSDASRVESIALEAGFDIPGDIAILGAGDDIPLCEAQAIPLSSVRHDLERNGYEGAKLLDELMHGGGGGNTARTVRLRPNGIAERGSTDAFAASDPLVKRALAVYRGDLANPPSTEQLAEALAVSRATLDRAFAADTGSSPARLLARLRLDEARRLLRETELSATEIAHRLGYCNLAYFTNLFRAASGVTPREFRTAGAGEPMTVQRGGGRQVRSAIA